MELKSTGPILPSANELTKFFWLGLEQRELRIQRCTSCRTYIHYPKPACRVCHSRELRGERVSGRARLHSWTVATQAFHPFWIERLPFVLATVELEEQARLMFFSQVVDCSEGELEVGLSLEVVFEQISAELVLPFFSPEAGPS